MIIEYADLQTYAWSWMLAGFVTALVWQLMSHVLVGVVGYFKRLLG